MTAEIVMFTGATLLDIDPDRVLNAATGKLEGAVVMGYLPDGEEYFASSFADVKTVLWLMERCKAQLLARTDE